MGNKFKKDYHRNKKKSVTSETTVEGPAAEIQDEGVQEEKMIKLEKMHS